MGEEVMRRVIGVLPSNWRLMFRLVTYTLLMTLVLVEIPMEVLRYAGAIKAVPGFMAVALSSLYASYGYGNMRDRSDGWLGAAVAGIVEATFFGGLVALVIAANRLPMIRIPYGIAALSLLVNWSMVSERHFGRRARDDRAAVRRPRPK
jgi:hypothetical protein